MTDEDKKYKDFLKKFISIAKIQATHSKLAASQCNDELDSFEHGAFLTYYSVFSLLKIQSFILNVNEIEIGLADIDPDRDLL